MDSLFELISNPIVLFILIATISRMFKAKKNAEQQQRPVRPANRPQKQPDTGTLIEDRRDTRRGSKRESVPAHPNVNDSEAVTGTLSEIQKLYEQRKEFSEIKNSKHRNDGEGRMSSGISKGRLKQEKVEEEPVIEFSPEPDRIVEGVIWAELLGKPRSKNPFHPGNRNR